MEMQYVVGPWESITECLDGMAAFEGIITSEPMKDLSEKKYYFLAILQEDLYSPGDLIRMALDDISNALPMKRKASACPKRQYIYEDTYNFLEQMFNKNKDLI